jgi:hypothetical protein
MDYSQACVDVAGLWATAYKALEDELGGATAVALAPTVLPPLLASAERIAAQQAAERFQLLEREAMQQWKEQAQADAPVIDAFIPRNPW